MTKIEWTEATWNPTTGCTKVSAGCTHCYAEKMSNRLHALGVKKYKNKFKLTLHPDSLGLPLKWKKPKKIFVNSMSDLFHEDVPFHFIDKLFDIMKKCPQHQFQILTKRPRRMHEYMKEKVPLDNVWLGTTIENEDNLWRTSFLINTPAKVRFWSCEPLLGPLNDMGDFCLNGIDWIIVGGESGPNHRPMKPEWVREIRDQCREQGIAFFFKQWGGNTPKSGGRELDGKTYNEYPGGIK